MFYTYLSLLSLCWVASSLLVYKDKQNVRPYSGSKIYARRSNNITKRIAKNNRELLLYDYTDKWWETLRTIPEISTGQRTKSYNKDSPNTFTEDKRDKAIVTKSTGNDIPTTLHNNPDVIYINEMSRQQIASKINSHHKGNNDDGTTQVSTDYNVDKELDNVIRKEEFDLTRERRVAIDKVKNENPYNREYTDSKQENVEERKKSTDSLAKKDKFGEDKISPVLERDFKRILGRFEYEKHKSEGTFKILDMLTQNLSANHNEIVLNDFNDMVNGFKKNVNDLKLFPGLNVSFNRIVDYYNFTAQQFGEAAAKNLKLDLERKRQEEADSDINSLTSTFDFSEGITTPYNPNGQEEMTEFVKYLYLQKAESREGYFTTFLVELFDVIPKKANKDVRLLCLSMPWEFDVLTKQDKYILSFGRPFLEVLQGFAEKVAVTPPDYVKKQAALLYDILTGQREYLMPQVTAIMNYIDNLFENKEGDDLFKALETIYKFPNVTENPHEVLRKLSSVLFAPFKRLAGTEKRRLLIESINQEIERVKTASENAGNVRRLGMFNNKTRFDVINRDLREDDKYVITNNTDDAVQTWTTSFYETGNKKKSTIKNTAKSAKPVIRDLKVTNVAYIQPVGVFGKLERYKNVKKNIKKYPEVYPKISNYYKIPTRHLKNSPESHSSVTKQQKSKKFMYTKLINTKFLEKTTKSTGKYKLHKKGYANYPSTNIEYNKINAVKNIARTFPSIDKKGTKANSNDFYSKSTTSIPNRFSTTRGIVKFPTIPRKRFLILIRHDKTTKSNKAKAKYLTEKSHLKLKDINKNKNDNGLLNKIRDYSSYSDEEEALKFNLRDAMRHDKINIKRRHNDDEKTVNENKLLRFSSYSGEEVALKSNLYKGFGFNHVLSSNLSNIAQRVDVIKLKTTIKGIKL